MGHVLMRHESTRSRVYAEPEADVDVDVEVLREKAVEHMMITACTVYNEAIGKHEWRPLWGTTPIMLGLYGVGVQLYFEFLVAVGVLFVVLFTLSVPTLVTSLLGSLVDDLRQTADVGAVYRLMAFFSVANLGSCKDCEDSAAIRRRKIREGSATMVAQITPWLGFLDGVALFVVIVFGVWFYSYWIRRTQAKQDEAHVTAADYSVQVTLLPRRLPEELHRNYEAELRCHFELLLRSLGVEDDEAVVEEVALVREYDGGICDFMRQGELLEQRHNLQVVKQMKERQGDTKGADLCAQQILRLEARLVAIEDALQEQATKDDEDRDVCGAFLMFRREAHKELILHHYRTSRSFAFRLFQLESMRFCERRISVVQACEPTDLFWENLDFHPWKRRFRQWSTKLISWSTIVACIWLLVYFKSVERASDTTVRQNSLWVLRNPTAECWKVCSWEASASLTCDSREAVMPAEFVSARGLEAFSSNTTSVEGSCWASPACAGGVASAAAGDWIALRLAEPKVIQCMKLKGPEDNVPPRLEMYACPDTGWNGTVGGAWRPEDDCVRMLDVYPRTATAGALQVVVDGACINQVSTASALGAWHTEDRVGSPRIRCFCRQQVKAHGLGFEHSPYNTVEKQICEEWSRNELRKMAYLVLAIVVVLVLNQLMLVVFTYLDRLARHETATDLSKSQLLNLFWTQLVNTGGMALLVSMNFRSALGQANLEWTHMGSGPYDDFTTSWFVLVGTSLFQTIIGQAISCAVLPVFWGFVVNPLYVKFSQKGLVTQTLLNDLYTLRDWTLSLRLAESMTLVFCVIMYGGGMPLLYAVGLGYCALAYWVDKLTLLRFSRQPPAVEGSMVSLAMLIFPIAAIIHALVTMLIFGQQDIFPSGWGPFLGLHEAIMGMTLERYEEVMSLYSNAGSKEREQLMADYIRARGLDCARQSCTLLYLLFLLLIAYYLVQTTHYIFRPVCTGLEIALREARRRATMHLPRFLEAFSIQAAETSDTYTEAREKAAKAKLVFSYKLSENPRYREACAALKFDPDAGMLEAAQRKKRDGKVTKTILDSLGFGLEHIGSGAEQVEARMLDRTEHALRHGARAVTAAKTALADAMEDIAHKATGVITKRSSAKARRDDSETEDEEWSPGDWEHDMTEGESPCKVRINKLPQPLPVHLAEDVHTMPAVWV